MCVAIHHRVAVAREVVCSHGTLQLGRDYITETSTQVQQFTFAFCQFEFHVFASGVQHEEVVHLNDHALKHGEANAAKNGIVKDCCLPPVVCGVEGHHDGSGGHDVQLSRDGFCAS